MPVHDGRPSDPPCRNSYCGSGPNDIDLTDNDIGLKANVEARKWVRLGTSADVCGTDPR